MTFVLVPGAGGDARYWDLLAPLLGPDTVAVSLPAADESAGLAAYADAIVAAAGDATDVVLVAQSMGGFSAPLAVDRLDVRRLVLLNAMVPRPGETFNEWWGAVGVPGHEVWDEEVIFFHDVPPDVRAAFLARSEPEQAARPCGEPFPLERWPEVPTSAIAGRDDRLFPPALQREYLRDRLGIEPTVGPGGHLVALSQPEALAAALLALL